jgi:sarcosine oxidase subunit gamma
MDAFPLNACTRTVLGKSEVTLWRTGGEMFHLEVARSYMPYVRLFLAEAGLGLG